MVEKPNKGKKYIRDVSLNPAGERQLSYHSYVTKILPLQINFKGKNAKEDFILPAMKS